MLLLVNGHNASCARSAEPLWAIMRFKHCSFFWATASHVQWHFYSIFFFILYTLYQCKPVPTASYQTKTVLCSTTQLGMRLACYSHRNEEPLEIYKAIPHQAKKTKLSVVVSEEKRCHSELASLCRSCGLKAKNGLVVPLLGTYWTAFIFLKKCNAHKESTEVDSLLQWHTTYDQYIII